MSLIEVVRTVRANPSLGHFAVKLGVKGATNKLSDARAAAVLAVLTEQNLESNRYELVLDDHLGSGVIVIVVTR